MKPIIIIPTYNESENIKPLLRALFDLQVPHLEVIVVDDNSPDGTAGIVKRLKRHHNKLHLISRKGKLGIGSAYREGFKRALQLDADLLFEMDADFSHDPEDIPRMIHKTQEGFDLVIGSRKIDGGGIVGWGYMRKAMSTGAMIFARLILGLKAQDVTAGFRCYRKEVLKKLNLNKIKSNGYAFQEEMLYLTQKNKFKIAEIPVVFKDRARGKSKLSRKDIFEFFVVMVKLKVNG